MFLPAGYSLHCQNKRCYWKYSHEQLLRYQPFLVSHNISSVVHTNNMTPDGRFKSKYKYMAIHGYK